jgi:5,10-methenyltetrahydromethanopterin hydrogenase
MNIKEQLEQIASSLNNEHIPFALIGGLAVGALGFQRFTNDIDLLIDGTMRTDVKRIFLAQGYSVFFESPEFLRLHSNGSPLDIMFANREISKNMLQSAKPIPGNASIKCLSPESIIGLKIQSYATNPKRSLKERADIQALIERHHINWDEIKSYADAFDKWSDIVEIRKITGK